MMYNINNHVKIKLTPYGENLHRNFYEKLNLPYKYVPPSKDNQGYSEFKLWEVMKIFGWVLYMGNTDVPFEMNIELLENLK